VKKVELGKAGECIAEVYLRQRGYLVWRPEEFIRLLELTVAYSAVAGECKQEPKEPLTLSVSTHVGYVYVTYWRGRCIPQLGREATEIERSLYAPCLKKCIEETLGRQLLEALGPIAPEFLAHRKILKTVDFFAYKDGVVYAVEVKTDGGKLSKAQVEKISVFSSVKHLAVRVHLQNPLVEINQL
jgi:hypothetical protein